MSASSFISYKFGKFVECFTVRIELEDRYSLVSKAIIGLQIFHGLPGVGTIALKPIKEVINIIGNLILVEI